MAIYDRHRRADSAAAAEKPSAIGFTLQVADAFSFGDEYVRRPDPGLVGGAGAASREQSTEFGNKLRLHEKFGKRRMGVVGCGSC